MPSLRHCRAPRVTGKPIEYILAEIADVRGNVDTEEARKVLSETPSFSLAPGAAYSDVWHYLQERKVIGYNGNRIYVPESTMVAYRKWKGKQ